MASSAPSPFHEPQISELPLHRKMVFFRKYVSATLLEFSLIAVVCTLIMLSPMARFYITENVWLLFLVCFLFFTSYLGLMHFTQMSVIKITLMLHVLIEALTTAVLVTYNDLMLLYQAVLLSEFCLLGMLLYAIQSKWDFNIWVAILNFIGCTMCFSALLKVMFGGTQEEDILSILVASFAIFYHTFFLLFFITKSTESDLICALVNAHTLPINILLYSSPIRKTVK